LFKQYREADGRFFFKLTEHDGMVLLQSQAFEEGRDAGKWVKRIRAEGLSAAQAAPVTLGDGTGWPAVEEALRRLMAHDALQAQRSAKPEAP
jgi:tryptophanyl-tRNA synthetase